MKILVATSDVPFVEGGHRVIARALVHAFQEAGHSAEIVLTPQNRFGRQFSAYLATRLTDIELTGLAEKVDRLISLRFPSYVLKHPNHVCWLNHRMREYYDLWDRFYSHLSPKARIKERIRRRMIHSADRYFLKRVRSVYAQSMNVQNNLWRWGKIPSQVLYPPPLQRQYRTDNYGDFLLSPSRLTPLKRIPLLLEALSQTNHAKAIITGGGADFESIRNLIRNYSLQDRVELTGHVGEDRILDLYARCRAIYYAPFNEDYGLVTLEAYRCRKPVVTATDSGGPTELVENNVTGFVSEPESKQMSAIITNLLEDSALAERMGTAGFEKYKHITWPETVGRLLE